MLLITLLSIEVLATGTVVDFKAELDWILDDADADILPPTIPNPNPKPNLIDFFM